MMKRNCTILWAALITLMLLLPVTVMGQGGISESTDEPIGITGSGVGYHYLTRAEMEEMKANAGVREPNVDYNVIVDGHNTGLAPPTEQQWEDLVGKLKVVDDVSTLMGDEPVPLDSMDLSKSLCFPAVGTQQLGSCGAWAMTYYSYGYLEATDNNWVEASLGNPDQLMSPVWTYNKVNGGTDTGSWMWDNGYILQDWGGALLSDLPCNGDPLPWGDETGFRNAPLHRAADVYQMPFDPFTSVDEVKALLNSGLPVTFCLDASEYGPGFADGNYVISSVEYDSVGMNHANTIVGYDDFITDDFEIGAFRVVNSWGDLWGDDGYYWMTYGMMNEIGNLDLLYLTYIEDVPDYIPTLLGSWHFNTAPSRDTDIMLGIGPHGFPLQTKTPFYNPDVDPSHRYPTYMCLDISEFKADYDLGITDFFVDLASGGASGTLSSFRVELYENNYTVGLATQTEAQSPDVPNPTPGYVTNDLNYYPPISINDAVDMPGIVFTTGDVAGWVGENYIHYYDGDAVQTGDVGDGELTYLQTLVNGPDTLSFRWKVSSELNNDYLSFYIDGLVRSTISGNVDWQEKTFPISAGAHTLKWEYSKDPSVSSGEDSGWVDMINLAQMTEPTVHVNSPNGGELFVGGGSCSITWTVDSGFPLLPNPITIEYSDTGSGGPWLSIAGNEQNDGTYSWDPLPMIDSINCYVRVTAENIFGSTGDDVSDSGFEIDSTAPSPATNARAELTGSNDVTVYWDPSPSPDVDHYEVWYIMNNWDPTGGTYTLLADTALATSYQHPNAGGSNTNPYFYQLRTFDTVGHETRTTIQAGKIGNTLSIFANPSGWFLLGSFLVQSDTSLGHVIQGQGFPTNWDHVQGYDPTGAGWESHLKGRPDTVNHLTDIMNEDGFWLHVTDNSRWTTAGYVTDMSIDLKAGWNLVPYPYAQRSKTAAEVEVDLTVNCPNFDSWQIFDSSDAYRLTTPTGAEILMHGSGMWVHVTADTTWTVINYY